MIAIDFLALVLFLALVIHLFYPRWSFVSVEEKNEVQIVTLKREIKLPFTKATTHVFMGGPVSWFNPDGTPAESTMCLRITRFLRFAEIHNRLAAPEKQS